MRRRTWEKIFAILTVCFTLWLLLMLGVDAFLKEVLDVSQKSRDWIAAPGVVGFMGALFSAWAWWSEVKVKRRVQEHEEKMRADKQAAERAEEELRIVEAARARREENERRRHVVDALRRAKERRRRAEEEPQRKHIESLLRRGSAMDEINYMSGLQFEKFMANLLRQQGYRVEETKASGDQGVDLVLPDIDNKRVVVQLKRYTRPVTNAAIQATFAGMAHYQADEGWVITTSTFTRSARELARSTRVRLIDGKELAEWLESLKKQE